MLPRPVDDGVIAAARKACLRRSCSSRSLASRRSGSRCQCSKPPRPCPTASATVFGAGAFPDSRRPPNCRGQSLLPSRARVCLIPAGPRLPPAASDRAVTSSPAGIERHLFYGLHGVEVERNAKPSRDCAVSGQTSWISPAFVAAKPPWPASPRDGKVVELLVDDAACRVDVEK